MQGHALFGEMEMKQFLAGALVGISCSFAFGAAAAITPDTVKGVDTFSQVIENVQTRYIQERTVADLIDLALHSMLQGLDPHSRYMNAKEYAAAQSFTAGGAGVGLSLTSQFGLTTVITPIAGSPAAIAGIEPGDRILAIDGKNARDMPLDAVIEALRGPEKSQIILTVQRGDNQIDFTLTRAVVTLEDVTAERKGNIGYIRISAFQGATDQHLASAISRLKQEIGSDLKGYIVDLRNCPGGQLNQAIQISDEFLNAGQIVSLRGRSAEDNQTYSARSGDITDGKPLLVLINEGSAAGTEIVAGALQDNKRATILGMKSFGDGTVQTIIPLSSGNGALRLTTASFYTPLGHPIQISGIAPDILVSQKPAAESHSRFDREETLPKHLEQETGTTSASGQIIYPDVEEQSSADFQLGYAINWMNTASSTQAR